MRHIIELTEQDVKEAIASHIKEKFGLTVEASKVEVKLHQHYDDDAEFVGAEVEVQT